MSVLSVHGMMETMQHVLLDNTEAKKVYAWFSQIFQVSVIASGTILERFRSWIYSSDFLKTGHVRVLIPMLISWFVWLARNNAKYDKEVIKADKIILRVLNFIFISHKEKPFERNMWMGDLKVAKLWNIGFKPRLINGPKLFTGNHLTMVYLK